MSFLIFFICLLLGSISSIPTCPSGEDRLILNIDTDSYLSILATPVPPSFLGPSLPALTTVGLSEQDTRWCFSNSDFYTAGTTTSTKIILSEDVTSIPLTKRVLKVVLQDGNYVVAIGDETISGPIPLDELWNVKYEPVVDLYTIRNKSPIGKKSLSADLSGEPDKGNILNYYNMLSTLQQWDINP